MGNFLRYNLFNFDMKGSHDMKKLIATLAIASMGFAPVAYAQSTATTTATSTYLALEP